MSPTTSPQTAAPLAPSHPVARFQRLFAALAPGVHMALDEVYAPGIVFEDPIHRIEGRDNLRLYFDRLNGNLESGSFDFEPPLLAEGRAFLPWTMRLRPRRMGKTIVVPGGSVLTFDALITHQRDFFDVGALIYEHLPLIGGLLRALKRRL